VSIRHIILTACLGAALLVSPAQAEDLQSALVSVYETNPRLLAERARLREIDETYVQARAAGRPTISGTGSIAQSGVNFPGGAAVFSGAPVGSTDADFSVSGRPSEIGVQIVQPLYQGGRVKAQKEQAKLSILAARENLRAQENELFLSAASAYADVRRDLEATRIRRHDVSVLSQRVLRLVLGRKQILPNQNRAWRSQNPALRKPRRSSHFLKLVLRGLLVGQLPPYPQLIGAYFNEAAGRAAIDVAKAAGRPTISLSGGLSRQREQLSQLQSIDGASITAQVTVPIYSGGANTSRRRQAEHAKTRLAFETRDAELAIDQSVTQIWAQLTAARASLEAAKRQVSAAQLAFEGVTLEQTVGTRDQLDVLNAEQETLNAQLSVIEAERNVSVATYQLLSTIGVFDAVGIRLPVNGYDEKPENWDEEGTLEILTEPIKPASLPPYNPLLDGDRDGKNDDIYRSTDSPVD